MYSESELPIQPTTASSTPAVYKVDITIHGGVPTRALIDSGSQLQVCIIRQQILPIVKEKCNWNLSDCVSRNLPLNAQPVGAEGSALGATALVKLEIVIEATGTKLTVPCYVINSTKPVWQGDVFVNQTFAVVLKHTVQIMPGITKWIEVLVQEQPRITDLGADFTSCSATDTQEMSEQCTESSIPQYPYTKADQINLQQSFL